MRILVHLGEKIIGGLAAVLLLSVVSTASESDSVKLASDASHEIIRESIASGDGGRLVSVFHSGGAIISPGGQTIIGRLTIRATATLLMKTMGTAQLTITRHDLILIGKTAYETGQYSLKQPLENERHRTYSGRYTLIWKEEDDEWKIYRVIGIR